MGKPSAKSCKGHPTFGISQEVICQPSQVFSENLSYSALLEGTNNAQKNRYCVAKDLLQL